MVAMEHKKTLQMYKVKTIFSKLIKIFTDDDGNNYYALTTMNNNLNNNCKKKFDHLFYQKSPSILKKISSIFTRNTIYFSQFHQNKYKNCDHQNSNFNI